MDSVLIIGTGFVGGNLALRADNSWEVYVTSHISAIDRKVPGKIFPLDITDRRQTFDLIKAIAPKVIVHTAAISSPAQCAEDRELGWQVNAEGTENVAAAAEASSSRLVFLSTDLVYNGSGSFYKETDPAVPSCFYGETKLAAEKTIVKHCSNYCILRVALVHGAGVSGKKRFTESFIEKLKDGQSVELFSNEYRSLIHVNDLCDAVLEMSRRTEFNGVLNAGGPERISRYEFGVKAARIFGFDIELVKPAPVNQKLFNDHRPEDCSMNIDKLESILGKKPMTVEEGLELMRTDMYTDHD